MRNIRTVFNQAISRKIISPELYPFGKGKYVPPSSKKAKKASPIEVIEKIYNFKSDNPQEEKAKDMWLFAYFANGMNVKDIAFLKYENIKDGTLSFIREKTKHSTKDIFKKSKFLLPKILTGLLINGEENLEEQHLLFLIFFTQKIYLMYKFIEISIKP